MILPIFPVKVFQAIRLHRLYSTESHPTPDKYLNQLIAEFVLEDIFEVNKKINHALKNLTDGRSTTVFSSFKLDENPFVINIIVFNSIDKISDIEKGIVIQIENTDGEINPQIREQINSFGFAVYNKNSRLITNANIRDDLCKEDTVSLVIDCGNLALSLEPCHKLNDLIQKHYKVNKQPKHDDITLIVFDSTESLLVP